jgi:hypothetical protein
MPKDNKNRKRRPGESRRHRGAAPANDTGALVSTWASEPCLIHFFLPSAFPIPIIAGSTLSIARPEHIQSLVGTQLVPTNEFLPNGEDAALESDGSNFVSFRFFQSSNRPAANNTGGSDFLHEVIRRVRPDIPIRKNPPISAPILNDLAYHETVIEMVTFLIPELVDDMPSPDASVRVAMDRCIETLQVLLTAYRVITGDVGIGALNLHSMYPFVLFAQHRYSAHLGWDGVIPE